MSERASSHTRASAIPIALGRALDARFEAMYRRQGGRYLDYYALEYTVFGQAFMLLAVPVLGLVLDLDAGQWWFTLALTQLASLVGVLAGVLHIRRHPGRALLEYWRAGKPAELAPAAWRSAVELARVGFLVHLGYSVALTGIPIAVIGGIEYGLSVAGTVLLFLSIMCGGIWPIVLGMLIGELRMGPVVRELAALVPESERGGERGILLSPKLVLALPAVNVGTGGFGVILLATTSDLSFEDVGSGILIAIAVSFTTSLVLTLLIARLVIEPLNALRTATQQVGAGDLGTRLPVLGADEFGNVNANFNAMVIELQRARERLIAAREEERKRIRRDLHDGLGPTLAAMPVHLEAVRSLMREDPAAAEEVLDDLSAEARGAIGDIRRLVRDLRPASLDEQGLMGALEEVARRLGGRDGIAVELRGGTGASALPAAVEVAAFRIGQEALTNVLRHAQASHVVLSIDRAEDVLALEVLDDGCGIPAQSDGGIGLASMHARATEVGGTCVVCAGDEGGTRVVARLPL